MKLVSKRLFAALCAVTASAALTVSVGAVDRTNDKRIALNRFAGFCENKNDCGIDDPNCLKEKIGNSNVFIGQIGSGNLEALLEEIRNNGNNCVRPPQCEPDFPIKPEPPETPDLPIKPEPPEAPDIPIFPEEPEVPSIPEKPDDNALSSFSAEVVRLVNLERAKAGLDALSTSSGIQRAAQVRAVEQTESFSHTRPDGTSCFTALDDAGVTYRNAGENIAYGQKTPAAVMNGWMNSSGHRANILGENFTEIGVGLHKSNNGTYYWTQMFIG